VYIAALVLLGELGREDLAVIRRLIPQRSLA
jgi:hypothetical protein